MDDPILWIVLFHAVIFLIVVVDDSFNLTKKNKKDEE